MGTQISLLSFGKVCAPFLGRHAAEPADAATATRSSQGQASVCSSLAEIEENINQVLLQKKDKFEYDDKEHKMITEMINKVSDELLLALRAHAKQQTTNANQAAAEHQAQAYDHIAPGLEFENQTEADKSIENAWAELGYKSTVVNIIEREVERRKLSISPPHNVNKTHIANWFTQRKLRSQNKEAKIERRRAKKERLRSRRAVAQAEAVTKEKCKAPSYT
jgi:hypothetical protein